MCYEKTYDNKYLNVYLKFVATNLFILNMKYFHELSILMKNY